MLYLSIFLCGAGPACEFFSIPEYWNPDFIMGAAISTPLGTWKFGIEDVIGSIGFVGIAVFFFELFQKSYNGLQKRSIIPVIRILGLTSLGLMLICIFYFIVGIRGIHSTNFSNAILCIIIILIRPAYLKTSLITALICSFLYWLVLQFIIFVVKQDVFDVVWNPGGRFGLMVAGVPIEEVIWAFLLAFFVGPLYRISFHLKNNSKHEAWYLSKISRINILRQ